MQICVLYCDVREFSKDGLSNAVSRSALSRGAPVDTKCGRYCCAKEDTRGKFSAAAYIDFLEDRLEIILHRVWGYL